jgi:hypothetical protein
MRCRHQVSQLLKPGYGMDYKYSTYEDRVEIVELFKKLGLPMSSAMCNDYKSALKVYSLFININKDLYFAIESNSVHEHLSLSQWKRKIFGLPVPKIIDNTDESSTNTFLDKQIKQLEN